MRLHPFTPRDRDAAAKLLAEWRKQWPEIDRFFADYYVCQLVERSPFEPAGECQPVPRPWMYSRDLL